MKAIGRTITIHVQTGVDTSDPPNPVFAVLTSVTDKSLDWSNTYEDATASDPASPTAAPWKEQLLTERQLTISIDEFYDDGAAQAYFRGKAEAGEDVSLKIVDPQYATYTGLFSITTQNVAAPDRGTQALSYSCMSNGAVTITAA